MIFDNWKVKALRLTLKNKDGADVTSSEVADSTGIIRSTLSSIENGRTINPSFDTTVLLCNYYNVSPYQLMKEETSKEMLANFLEKMFREGDIDLSSPEKCKASIHEYHFRKIKFDYSKADGEK